MFVPINYSAENAQNVIAMYFEWRIDSISHSPSMNTIYNPKRKLSASEYCVIRGSDGGCSYILIISRPCSVWAMTNHIFALICILAMIAVNTVESTTHSRTLPKHSSQFDGGEVIGTISKVSCTCRAAKSSVVIRCKWAANKRTQHWLYFPNKHPSFVFAHAQRERERERENKQQFCMWRGRQRRECSESLMQSTTMTTMGNVW